MKGAARLLQRDLGDLLVDEQRATRGHERAHANQAARRDLLRLPHALLAGDEGHHLRAPDDVAFDGDVILRVRIRGQVGHQIDVAEPRGVDRDQPPPPGHQREGPAVDLADADSVACDGGGEPAARDVLVDVARLQLEDVQLLPCRRVDRAHVRFREHAALLQAAEITRQDQARRNLLSPHDSPLVHRSLLGE